MVLCWFSLFQTGNENELLGTGRTSIKPFLIFSKSVSRFTPHLNLGYEFNSGSEGQDRIVYTTGVDYGFGKGNNHFSIASDIIGRHTFHSDPAVSVRCSSISKMFS